MNFCQAPGSKCPRSLRSRTTWRWRWKRCACALSRRFPARALRWAVEEMERRYQLLSEAGVRNISGYNKLVENVKGNAKELLKSTEERIVSPPEPPKVAKPGKKMLIVDVADGESEDQAI